MPSTTERVLSFPDALALVLEHAGTLRPQAVPQAVPLLESAGRVLAEPIRAERDQPPFHRSTRDGFALRAADLTATAPLTITGSIRAGQNYTGGPLEQGQAIEIMTGAPVPEGADAVLMVEHALVRKNILRLAPDRSLSSGENVVPRASEARAGAELVPVGRRLAASEVALAASCGLGRLRVFAPPRVAVVATGDELVEMEESGVQPEPWQIRNSNTYALSALVREAGGHPERLAIARDTRADIDARIRQSCAADLLLLSGGVSMGKYDLVEEALAAYGAKFLFTGTLIQPGKPLVLGRLPRNREQRIGNREQEPQPRHGTQGTEKGGCPGFGPSDPGSQGAQRSASVQTWQYFFGLPGNPVSTEVCFRLFVTPILRALAGQTDLPPRFVEARLAEDVRGGARVTRFLPAVFTSDWQSATVRLVPWQGSGDLAANARANCFAVLPADVPTFSAGQTVRVLLR